MNKQRRLFLNQLSLMAGAAVLTRPMTSLAFAGKKINNIYSKANSITIYHTNDLHGNLYPLADDLGGLSQVKTLLKKQDVDGLLFDAGDFLNNSHNPAQQKQMIHTMNDMGYMAATIGNHELSLGQDALAALVPSMKFALVNCNYQFDQVLGNLVKPYIIVNSGRYKIGVTGVGHQLAGVKYNDAIQCANNMAAILKEKEKCDLVICLSHLGFQQDGDIADNQKLAQQSKNIDLIISGHNRKLLSGPRVLLNKLKHEVIISQAAWDGLMVGKVVFGFENGKEKNKFKGRNFIPGRTDDAFVASVAKLRTLERPLISA